MIGEPIKGIRDEKCLTPKEPNLGNHRMKNPTIHELKQIGAALSLLNIDRETTKAFCGNRNCTCNEPVPTYMEKGPFVHTWVAKCRDGEQRELGIRSYAFVPTYNEDGELNRYCPYCGEELIWVWLLWNDGPGDWV